MFAKENFYIDGIAQDVSLKAAVHSGQLDISVIEQTVNLKSSPFPALDRLMQYYKDSRHGENKASIKRNAILLFEDEVTLQSNKLISTSDNDKLYFEILKEEKVIRRCIWMNNIWSLINDNELSLNLFCQDSDLEYFLESTRKSDDKKFIIKILNVISKINVKNVSQSVLSALESTIIHFLNAPENSENIIIITMLIDLLPKFKEGNNVSGLLYILDKIDLKKDLRLTSNLVRLFRKIERFDKVNSKISEIEKLGPVPNRVSIEKTIVDIITNSNSKSWDELKRLYLSSNKDELNNFIYGVSEIVEFYQFKNQYRSILIQPKFLDLLNDLKQIDIEMILPHLRNKLEQLRSQ